MAQLGMDVDLVEQSADALAARAADVGALTAAIDRVVRTLPSVWDGRDATAFVTQWWPEHRAALTAVQDAVAGLARSARENAAEQRQASGPSRSAGPGAGTGTGISTRDIYDAVDGALETEVLGGWSVKDITQFVPGLGVIYTGYDVARALQTGQDGGDAAMSTIATALKGGGQAIPAVYLTGVLVSEVQLIAEQAGQIDWSPQATASTFGYMAEHPGEAVKAAAEAVWDEVPSLLSVFF